MTSMKILYLKRKACGGQGDKTMLWTLSRYTHTRSPLVVNREEISSGNRRPERSAQIGSHSSRSASPIFPLRSCSRSCSLSGISRTIASPPSDKKRSCCVEFNRSGRLGLWTHFCWSPWSRSFRNSLSPPNHVSRPHAPHAHSYGIKYPSWAVKRCRLVVRESRSGFINRDAHTRIH